MTTRTLLILSLCAWGAGPPSADVAASQVTTRPSKLLPVDVAKADPGLRRLRKQLLDAAASQSVARLMPLLGKRVRGKIGDEFDVPREEFPKEFARYSAADQMMFWQGLRDAVSLGFARLTVMGQEEVCAPYVYALLEEASEEDGEQILVVTANGVNVRAGPDISSPVIETLHYDFVHDGPELGTRATKPGEFGGAYEWLQIKTPKNRLGWVLSKYIYDSATIRFFFSKIGGEWKLTVFGSAE